MPITINSVSTNISTIGYVQPFSDSKWEDGDLQKLLTRLQEVSPPFKATTDDNAAFCIAEFIFNCALNWANSKSDFEGASVGHSLTTPVPYGKIAKAIDHCQLNWYAMYRTFATDIYNNCRRINVWSSKYSDKGYPFDARFVAFPGSTYIKQDLASPKLSKLEIESASANKKAAIQTAKEDVGPISTHSFFYTPRTPRVTLNPTLQITNH